MKHSDSPNLTAPQHTRELDRIYNDPTTAPALDLLNRFHQKSLGKDGLKNYLDTLSDDIRAERKKLEEFLEKPTNNVQADLSTRPHQLLWAAGLAHVSHGKNPSKIRAHPIWQILTQNSYISNSLGSAARYIDLSITNRNAKMDWGTPGSHFWFNPEHNYINIDLFSTLLAGFEENPAPNVKGLAHSVGVMLHEIGHAQLTTRFTDRMIELTEQEKSLRDLANNRELTEEEFLDLVRIQTEFRLRMNIFNAAEDNCVNQYAVNQGNDFPHNFGAFLNVCNVLIQGTGNQIQITEQEEYPAQKLSPIPKNPADDVKQAEKALRNLSYVIVQSFYASNGLFDIDDLEAWNKIGIDHGSISTIDNSNSQTKNSGAQENNFKKLLDLNIGPEGISHRQPTLRDRWLLRSIFRKSVKSYATQRCELIDEIWNKYAAHHAEILIDHTVQTAKNKMAEQQQSKNTQDNESNSQNNPSPSSQKNSEKQNSPRDNQPNNGATAPNADDSQQGEASGENNTEESDVGSESNEHAPINVKDVGPMQAGDTLPTTPKDARTRETKSHTEEIDASTARTLRDLAEETKKQPGQNGANHDQGQASLPGNPDALSMKSKSDHGGRQKGVDLKALAKGDWTKFRTRINELEPVIRPVSENFGYILSRQKQRTLSISSKTEQLPRGGNPLQRLDMRRQTSLSIKRATQQRIENHDLQRWHMDKAQDENTSVELWLLCDGSGSMDYDLPSGGRRIDSAVQSMAVLYEAARRENLEAYAGMWGDDELRILASPGDDDKTVGDNFQRIKDGINSGTILSPAFQQAMKHSAKQEHNALGKTKRFAGMTHFLILSDGDLHSGDTSPLVNTLNALFNYGPPVSVDVAILKGSGTEMEGVISQVKKTHPTAAIDVIVTPDAKNIPILLSQQIKKRMERSAENMRATPDTVKRDAFNTVNHIIEATIK